MKESYSFISSVDSLKNGVTQSNVQVRIYCCLKKKGFVILCVLTGHHSPTTVMQKNVMNCKGSYSKPISINSGCLHPYLMPTIPHQIKSYDIIFYFVQP